MVSLLFVGLCDTVATVLYSQGTVVAVYSESCASVTAGQCDVIAVVQRTV